MSKKVKLPRMTTPVGTLAYVWVDEPDDKFATKPSDKKYKASIVLDPADEGVEEFIAAMREAGEVVAAKLDIELEEGYKFAKSTPSTRGTKKKPVKEEFKGMYVLEAKTGVDYPPKRVDAARNVIEEHGVIRSGDRGRLAVTISPYEAFGSGLSLRLNAVQLIEKRAAGGSDDFDDFEGGYTHAPKAATDTASDEDEDDDDDNDDF